MSAAPYSLPALPYAYNALEPHIDEATSAFHFFRARSYSTWPLSDERPPHPRPPPRTPPPSAAAVKVHHTGHHQTYTTNLNLALEKLKAAAPELAALPLAALLQRLVEVPAALKGPLRNSGGGCVNHDLFFTQWMAPPGAPGVGPSPPEGSALAAAIASSFGSVDKLKEDFSAAAATVFGSGWAWLVVDRTGAAPVLKVAATPNQDTPAMTPGTVPILGLDVWEHAYYLKYQNKRAAYISAWWNVVNWPAVEKMYAEAIAVKA